MSPARKRRVRRQRVVRFGAENWKGLSGLVVAALIAFRSERGIDSVRTTATHADNQAQAVAAVAVSGAELGDALSARVGALELRLESVERQQRRGRKAVVDTIRVSPVPLGPQEPSKGLLFHLLHPWGR